MAEGDRFIWRIPLFATLAAVFIMLLSFVYASDPVLDYLFDPTDSLALEAKSGQNASYKKAQRRALPS